jgi:hypothetical protein
MERYLALFAILTFPERRHAIPGRRIDRCVPINDVVRDIDLATDILVRELWPIRIIPNLLIWLIELDIEILVEDIPKPLQARCREHVNVTRCPVNEFGIIVDAVCLHEVIDIRGFDELRGWFVDNLIEFVER